jgi:hypothetical protein
LPARPSTVGCGPAISTRVICGRGRPGSGRLNQALDSYDPRLAYANGRLEFGFYVFCERRERTGIPLPELNVSIGGIRVDAYFRAYALVVELDGDDNHRTPAQRRRDRRNELKLRTHGIEVVRYDWALVEDEPALVEQDLLAALARRAEFVRRRAQGRSVPPPLRAVAWSCRGRSAVRPPAARSRRSLAHLTDPPRLPPVASV